LNVHVLKVVPDDSWSIKFLQGQTWFFTTQEALDDFLDRFSESSFEDRAFISWEQEVYESADRAPVEFT